MKYARMVHVMLVSIGEFILVDWAGLILYKILYYIVVI
jgi:hypothetical protein